MYKYLSRPLLKSSNLILCLLRKEQSEYDFFSAIYRIPFFRQIYLNGIEKVQSQHSKSRDDFHLFLNETQTLIDKAVNNNYPANHPGWENILLRRITLVKDAAFFETNDLYQKCVDDTCESPVSRPHYFQMMCEKSIPLHHVLQMARHMVYIELDIQRLYAKGVASFVENKLKYYSTSQEYQRVFDDALNNDKGDFEDIDPFEKIASPKFNMATLSVVLKLNYIETSFRIFCYQKDKGISFEADLEDMVQICFDVLELYKQISSNNQDIKYHIAHILNWDLDDNINHYFGMMLDAFIGAVPIETETIPKMLDLARLLTGHPNFRSVLITAKILSSRLANDDQIDDALDIFYKALPKTNDKRLDPYAIRDGLKPYFDVMGKSDKELDEHRKAIQNEVFHTIDTSKLTQLKQISRTVIHYVFQICFYLDKDNDKETVKTLYDVLFLQNRHLFKSATTSPEPVETVENRSSENIKKTNSLNPKKNKHRKRKPVSSGKPAMGEDSPVPVESEKPVEAPLEVAVVKHDVSPVEIAISAEPKQVLKKEKEQLSVKTLPIWKELETTPFEEFLRRYHCYDIYTSLFYSKPNVKVKDFKKLVETLGGTFWNGKGSHTNGYVPEFMEQNYGFQLSNKKNPSQMKATTLASFDAQSSSRLTLSQSDNEILKRYQVTQIKRSLDMLGYPAIL